MQKFLHKRTDDKRSANQIALTKKLTQALTELNLKRFKQSSLPSQGTHQSLQPNNLKVVTDQTLFVCIKGIPPFQDEFDNLNFPGPKIKFMLPGFESDLTQQQLRKRAISCDFNAFSHQMNQKIQQFPSSYSLVFVYHSFGTFIASYYFKNYFKQEQHRIKGIIQLGGGPIRVYPVIQPGLVPSFSMTKEFIEENIDFIFGKFTQLQSQWATKNIKITPYKSKYNLLAAFFSYKTEGFHEIFQLNRRLPKILKLFVYGDKDTVFECKNIDQKSIYYLYNTDAKLNQDYAKMMCQKYKKIHGQSAQNIQQRFIYKIPQGKHSLHMQKQFVPLIQKLIDDYLQMIF